MPPKRLESKPVTLQRQLDAAREARLTDDAEVDLVEAAAKQQRARPTDGGLAQT